MTSTLQNPQTITVAAPPSTDEVVAQMLSMMAALTGVITDYNQGSQIRTMATSVGSVTEQQGIWAQAQAYQALIYSALSLFGIQPGVAVPASGVVTFSTSVSGSVPASQTVTIPAGTIVQTAGGVQFQTTSLVTLVSGATSINANIAAAVSGTAGNVGAGTVNTIISGLLYPLFVNNASAISGGSNAISAAQSFALFAAMVAAIGLSSPVAIANSAVGTAYGSEVVMFSTCFDKETEVLTDIGWYYFKDAPEHAKFATLNTENHRLEYQESLARQSYVFCGDLIKVENKFIDLAVTPDHRLYIRSREGVNWRFITASELKPSHIIKRDAFWDSEDEEFYIVGAQKIPMDIWLEFLGYFISEGSATISHQKKKNTHRVKDAKYRWKKGIKPTLDITRYTVTIAQHKKSGVKKLDEFLRKMPYKAHKTNSGFVICSRELTEELRVLGKSNQKYIPHYAKNVSRRQLSILLEALIFGDGYDGRERDDTHHTEVIYHTSSKKLADDVQEIAFKVGYPSTIKVENRIGRPVIIKGRGITGKTNHLAYIVRLHQSSNEIQVTNKPERIPYDDNVFCVTVPNHTVYVRRNGKCCWAGQCTEPWIIAGSGAGSGTAGWNLYIDNGTGTASTNLINTVITKLNGGSVSGAANAGGITGYRDAGVPYNVYAVTPTSAYVAVSASVASGASASLVSGAIASAVSGYFTLPFGATAAQAQIAASVANAVAGQITALTVTLSTSVTGVSVTGVTTSISGRVVLGSLTQTVS